MAERKQTPDILGEILEGAIPPAVTVTVDPARPQPRLAEPHSAQVRATRPGSLHMRPANWEYLVVSFQQHNGWRARYVNGDELPAWSNGQVIHEYLEARGGEGWELATASSGERMYGNSDLYQLYFKRQALIDSTRTRS